jgi:protein involved in polysaccharide export with SLBB domain
MSSSVLRIALQCTLVLAAAVFAIRAQDAAAIERAALEAQDTVVGADDSVTIFVLDAENISKTWRVGPTGELQLPDAGLIQAGGMTVQQLTATVAARLKKYIREPRVSIFVSEQRSRPIQVTGAVDKPGTYQMGGRVSLYEILLRAGGPKASGPKVTIRRNSAFGPLEIPGVPRHQDQGFTYAELDLAEVMTGHGDKALFHLNPHDIVSVSPAPPPRYVHITGEVLHPGAVELVTQDTVSLMMVVAKAGGTSAIADLGKLAIFHSSSEGGPASDPVFIDFKKIQKGKAKDLLLAPGDIVYIARSGIKAFIQTATNAAMSTGISSGVLVLARI